MQTQEQITEWTSHKHPENLNFMQKVRYMHIAYSDGRNSLYWRLVNSSQNDTHIIPNITLSEAQDKFVDIDEEDIEISYQKWLSSNNL